MSAGGQTGAGEEQTEAGASRAEPQEVRATGAGGSFGDEEGMGAEPKLIDAESLRSWILVERPDLVVVNKPGWVVCHPSKNGPWSSLVGACREYFQAETIHLVARLDRETSGLVVLARTRGMARRLQMALERRQVRKVYAVVVRGAWEAPAGGWVTVNQPLARDLASPVVSKQTVRADRTAQEAVTRFLPVAQGGGWTLALAEPLTGRKHQIRAHAEWLGYPVEGDKVYGPDATLFLEFIEHGWTERLGQALALPRQGLHALHLRFGEGERALEFTAPLPEDLRVFVAERMGLGAEAAGPEWLLAQFRKAEGEPAGGAADVAGFSPE